MCCIGGQCHRQAHIVPSKALRLILLNFSEAEKRYAPPYGACPVARLRKAAMEDSLRALQPKRMPGGRTDHPALRCRWNSSPRTPSSACRLRPGTTSTGWAPHGGPDPPQPTGNNSQSPPVRRHAPGTAAPQLDVKKKATRLRLY